MYHGMYYAAPSLIMGQAQILTATIMGQGQIITTKFIVGVTSTASLTIRAKVEPRLRNTQLMNPFTTAPTNLGILHLEIVRDVFSQC